MVGVWSIASCPSHDLHSKDKDVLGACSQHVSVHRRKGLYSTWPVTTPGFFWAC